MVDVIQVRPDWSYVGSDGARGFVPTSVLQTRDHKPLTVESAEAAPKEKGGAAKQVFAVMRVDYTAETPESLR